MSAIAKVLMQQLTAGLDEETKKYLTPEGMKQLGEVAGKTFDFFRGSQVHQIRQNDAILANQKIIMETLNVGEQFNSGPSVNTGGNASSDADASVAA